MYHTQIQTQAIFKYATLAFPLSFVSLPIYIHVPAFYATEHNISIYSIATSLLFLRLIDAVCDPIIGIASDRFKQYRQTIVTCGLILLVLSVLMLFNKPQFNTLAWFILSVFLATTAYSIISINYYAIGAIYSSNQNERTKITTIREAVGLIGLLIASALPSILRNHYPDQIALSYFSYIFIFVTLIFGSTFLSWCKNNPQILKNSTSSLDVEITDIRVCFKNNWSFFLVMAISSFASAIPSVLVLFFINDVLKLEEYSGLFLLFYFLSGALSMPLWQYLSKRCGKINSWLISMIIAVITFSWVFLLEAKDFWQYLIICFLSGISFGAELSIPPSLLADLTDKEDNLRSTSFSILTFIIKFVLALSSGIILYLLAIASYEPGKINTQKGLFWLSFYYGLLPCIIKLIAIVFLGFIQRKHLLIGEK